MPVKRYKTKSIQDALRKIKRDMGPDAMILSTKRIPKCARSPYGHDLFEVSASSGSESAHYQSPEHNSGHNQASCTRQSPVLSENSWQMHEKEGASVKDEQVSMNDILFILDQQKTLPDFLHTLPGCLSLYTKLIRAGISENRVRAYIKKGSSHAASHGITYEDIKNSILKEIMQSIPIHNPFRLNGKKKHMAAFIGPTGVGKTTTIAKLAADLSLNHKKRVGLISIDGYRIGAVEQLNTYAAIMGIPCISAFTKKDVQIAVQKMQNRDIILIDTAGQSHLDKNRIKELGRLIGSNTSISSHLVLSASTNRLDMKEAVEKFSVFRPETYVFTKVDETKQRGRIIDQIQEKKIPVSFITNGQNVPEDITQATQKGILQLVLKN